MICVNPDFVYGVYDDYEPFIVSNILLILVLMKESQSRVGRVSRRGDRPYQLAAILSGSAMADRIAEVAMPRSLYGRFQV